MDWFYVIALVFGGVCMLIGYLHGSRSWQSRNADGMVFVSKKDPNYSKILLQIHPNDALAKGYILLQALPEDEEER